MDSSANGNDATAGSISWVSGKAGTAIDDPRLSLADSSDLILVGAVPFTISFWVKPPDSSQNFTCYAGFEGTAGHANDSYAIKCNGSDKLQLTPSGLTTPDTVWNYSNSGANWVHVVGVHEPGVGSRIYINGNATPVATGSAGSIPNPTNHDFTIGSYPGGSYGLDASMDDVQVYDQALSSAEVTTLYANPGFDLFSVPSGTVTMTTPSAGTITDDGATVESTLLGADATDVTVVWAYADQGETTVGTWTGAAGGDSYSFGPASENDILSHAITGLDGDTEYNFRFVATGASNTAWSGVGTFSTGLVSEPAPTGLAATAGANLAVTKVDLTWTDSYATETGFVIQRSTDSGFGGTPDEFTVGSDVTTYTDTTTDANTTYYYRIAAVGSTGTGAFSTGVEVTTGDAPPEGLLAHWKMDGGTIDDPGPTTLADSSGNGFDLAEDTRFSQGDYAAGVSDTGIVSPRYQADESLSRDLALENGSMVSLSAWIYLADDGGANDLNGSQCIAGYPGTGSSVDQYALTTASGGIIWNYNSNGSGQNVQANFTPAAEGGWYHVVGVYEAGVGGRSMSMVRASVAP